MSRSKTKWNQGSGGGNGKGSSYVGRVYHVDEYRLTVEDVIAEGRNSVPNLALCEFDQDILFRIGGFAVVMLVKSSSGQRFALKRLAVNNEQDLYLAKQEIAITVSLYALVMFLITKCYSLPTESFVRLQ